MIYTLIADDENNKNIPERITTEIPVFKIRSTSVINYHQPIKRHYNIYCVYRK